jgi:plastocyanin
MRKLTVVVALLSVLALACGNDDDLTVPEGPEETTEATDEASPSASGELTYNDEGTETFTTESFDAEVEVDDFSFKPTFIKSPGDATAKIELRNEGDSTHTFTSDTLDFDVELEPGATEEVTVEIGTETRYEFYCRFHQGQGMRGAFQPH